MNNNVVDFSDCAAKLAAKANEDQEYFAHMDRLMVDRGETQDGCRSFLKRGSCWWLLSLAEPPNLGLSIRRPTAFAGVGPFFESGAYLVWPNFGSINVHEV